MKNIHQDRIKCFNDADPNEKGKFILYWMTKSFREHWNYSLEYAVGIAEKYGCGVVVAISIEKSQKQYTERHLKFWWESLVDLKEQLSERKIKLIFKKGDTKEWLTEIADQAVCIVTDFVYLEEDRKQLERAFSKSKYKVDTIEGNVIVPVEAASDKQEYAARTIRGKLQDKYKDYLEKPVSSKLPKSTLSLSLTSDKVDSYKKFIRDLEFSNHTEEVQKYTGGYAEAKSKLERFLDSHLEDYDDKRQSPTDRSVSELSMYLRWGNISPAYIVSRIKNKSSSDSTEAYLEELLVRRELAHNYVHFTENYDSLNALPDWAAETLEKHKDDEREYHYTQKEFEDAETHDEPWNESMKRMKKNGYLHNHLRMYWGKQILAWTNTPQYALKTILYLNNKYFLDGNDPNSYANALWIFGLHDRAWQENDVFGKVRLMNRNGLDRKIDVEKFVNQNHKNDRK